MTRFHVNNDNEVKPCNAIKGNCPFGIERHFRNEKGAHEFAENENKQLYGHMAKSEYDIHQELLTYARNGNPLTDEEVRLRRDYVDRIVTQAIVDKLDTESLHFNSSIGLWAPERMNLHNKLLKQVIDKYEDVPSDGLLIMSGGLSGAGKTTVLDRYLGDTKSSYAVISSDDFKEFLAEEGAIPHIDGLTPMETSTLVHEESSYLADRLMYALAKKKKNVIYDFTARNEQSTKDRIDTFEAFGYDKKDMQLIFVDITIDTAKERAFNRYKYGLSSVNGGRYLPEDVIDKSAPHEGSMYNSINAGVVVDIYDKVLYNGNAPIIYDNSGREPIEINFNNFRRG